MLIDKAATAFSDGLLYKASNIAKAIEVNRRVVTRAWRGGHREPLFNGYKVSYTRQAPELCCTMFSSSMPRPIKVLCT